MLASSRPLWQWPAHHLAEAVRHGAVSAREAVAAAIDRVHAVNPALNAIVDVMDAQALADADAADAARRRGQALGPLHGVPVTVKVNVDCAGRATTNGVVAFKDQVAAEDSPVVANLRRAGAIVIGRTNTPAFSVRWFTDNDLHGAARLECISRRELDLVEDFLPGAVRHEHINATAFRVLALVLDRFTVHPAGLRFALALGSSATEF